MWFLFFSIFNAFDSHVDELAGCYEEEISCGLSRWTSELYFFYTNSSCAPRSVVSLKQCTASDVIADLTLHGHQCDINITYIRVINVKIDVFYLLSAAVKLVNYLFDTMWTVTSNT